MTATQAFLLFLSGSIFGSVLLVLVQLLWRAFCNSVEADNAHFHGRHWRD